MAHSGTALGAPGPSGLDDDYCATLEAENEVLRARVEDLEKILGMRIEVPFILGLTGKETEIFGMLMKRDLVTKDHAITTLYGHLPSDKDAAEPKIVDVFICKMRAKIVKFGIPIETIWGRGYAMTKETKGKVNELLVQQGLPPITI